jgi:hypothetical protein
VNERIQPHFKIHGSSNWTTADGRNLLVMGGDKEFMIREHKVLRWYYEQFLQRLAIGGTRLMVIGYSFSDRYINDAITEAAQRGTLTGMFLVDPAGWDVLNPTPPHHIRVLTTAPPSLRTRASPCLGRNMMLHRWKGSLIRPSAAQCSTASPSRN